MDIATILKSAGELGVLGTVAVILLLAYRDTTRQIADVVRNNTEAITRLCDNSSATAKALENHDERAERIEQAVGNVVRVSDRIESKIDRLSQTKPGCETGA